MCGNGEYSLCWFLLAISTDWRCIYCKFRLVWAIQRFDLVSFLYFLTICCISTLCCQWTTFLDRHALIIVTCFMNRDWSAWLQIAWQTTNLVINSDTSCLSCWTTLVRISTESLPDLDAHFSQICQITNNIDFYIDQLSPILVGITRLDLSGQSLHDDSGIIDNLSQLEELKQLNLSNNALSQQEKRL